jgi:TolB-like protein
MTLVPGSRLGPYEIVAPLGAGGMGEVFRAKDPRLGREVAIKVLPTEVAGDPDRLRRFEDEARAASALNHPNILTVHELGREDGTSFLVTELLAGESLRELLARGPLALPKALDLARQLARGLAAAHERGIVHRDLKPENLFLTRDGVAKILDFGLARREASALAEGALADASTRLETAAGTVLGTVGYMAPEQVRGERADARSDLFALGVVLHELLSGANPFRRESAIESLHAILRDEPPAVGSSPSGASSALGRIVARLLEKRPEARFQSARDLAFALDELATSPTGFAAPAATSRLRHRMLVGAALLALVVAAAVWLVRGRPGVGASATAKSIRSLAVLPFANLVAGGADDYFSDGMTDALTTELAHLSALKVIARNSAARFKGSPRPPAEIARELGVEALVSGSVLRAGDQVRISAQLAEAPTDRVVWAQSYERAAKDVLSLQSEVARAIASAVALELSPAEESRLDIRRTVEPRALDEYLKGRALWTRRSEESVRAALAHFRAATELDPGFALGHTGVADAHIILAAYNWMPPREAAPIALAAIERAMALDPTAGEPHASRGDLAFHVDLDFALARRVLDRAIELSPGYATAYHWRSEVLRATGHRDESIADLRRAVELDPLAVVPWSDLGSTLAQAGRFDEAERAARRAMELAPGLIRAERSLIRLELARGNASAALAQAQRLAERDDSESTAAELALCLVAAGRLDEARTLRARLSEPFALALVGAALGERAAALAALGRAFEQRDFRAAHVVQGEFARDFRALRGDPEFEALIAGIKGR